MTSPVLPAEPVGRVVFATATLSFVGGFVDVVGFIALFGLFTAHVTGNFIMLGLEMVHATKLAIGWWPVSSASWQWRCRMPGAGSFLPMTAGQR
jgi:uncharacterized protein DUF1275